jgi:TusE/DsrC/DsvC family sulfur relay protein
VNEEGYLTGHVTMERSHRRRHRRRGKCGPLTDAHMKVIRYLREQQAKGAALTIRGMGKSGVVTTKELYDLFPGGPLKKSSKIAGIPKPVGCI